MIKKTNNPEEIQKFLDNCGGSLDTFTYFDQRPTSIIKNHLLTILAYEDKKPVAYGHLEKEDNKIWLGICVAEKNQGQGFGKKIMAELLDFADKNFLEVTLSVKEHNKRAISLYTQLNFVPIMVKEKNIFMRRNHG